MSVILLIAFCCNYFYMLLTVHNVFIYVVEIVYVCMRLLYVVIILHNFVHMQSISVNQNGIRGRNFDVAFPNRELGMLQ
jgi:hypothetical protein